MVQCPSAGITRCEESPLLRCGMLSGDALQCYSGLFDLAPFLLDALALVAGKRGKEIFKIAIATIL